MDAIPTTNYQDALSAPHLKNHKEASNLKHRRCGERKGESRAQNIAFRRRGAIAHLMEIKIGSGRL